MKRFAFLSAVLVVAISPLTLAARASSSFDVKVTGRGRPMILIPGLACSGAVWDSTVAHFNDRFECHVVSLAGFAGSPPAIAEGPLLERVRDDLAAYIVEQKLERPVIVGHSLGGFLTLSLAARNPNLVGELVIVDGAPFLMGLLRPGASLEDGKAAAAGMRQGLLAMDDAAFQQSIRAGASTRPMVTSEEDHARIVGWSLASDRGAVTQAMTEMLSSDLTEELAGIQTPALVLASWIAYKPFVDHAGIEKAYREQFVRLPQVKLSITDVARHFIMLDDPEWLFSQMESFLSSAATAPTR